MANKKILVVATHPDDEALGCGGTIAKHAEAGDTVYVLIMTGSRTSRNQPVPDDHTLDIEASCDILGARIADVGEWPDNRLDTIPMIELASYITQHVKGIKPDIVYTHSFEDLNISHRMTAEATVIATRNSPSIQLVASYFVPSTTELGREPWQPNHFVEITEAQSELKAKALRQAYGSELRPWPHARSLDIIQVYEKMCGSIHGLEYAESFEILRQLA